MLKTIFVQNAIQSEETTVALPKKIKNNAWNAKNGTIMKMILKMKKGTV